MRKFILLVVILCSTYLSMNAQKVINKLLKHKLDSIYVLDQKYREATIILNNGGNADSIATCFHASKNGLFMFLVNEMQRVDSLNLEYVKQIYQQYGYPGKSLVGTPTNEVAWNVIQHSPHIDQYIGVIEKAAKKKEVPNTLYCKMLDRLLMEKNEEQIYGTQIKGLSITNKETGKKEWHMFVWPIRNQGKVNSKRKKAGFDKSIEEYARTFGISYLPMTLEDVRILQK